MTSSGVLKQLPFSASELIFGAKGRKEDDDGNEGGRGGAGDLMNFAQGVVGSTKLQKNLEHNDFFWDQLIIYVSSAILALTLLEITVEFFRGGGLYCYVPFELLEDDSSILLNPRYDISRDQALYINSFCQQNLSWSAYFPVFVVVQGILILAPHYLWASLFDGNFTFFFSLVQQLDRLRDSRKGEYNLKNFEIVKKLEREFPPSRKQIYGFYIGKMALQTFVLLISLAINAGVFTDFSSPFPCPSDLNKSSDHWKLPFKVSCVYSSFRLLQVLQVVDYLLVIVALAVACYGLLWCFKRHTTALGYKEIARFAFTSFLSPKHYVHKRFWKSPRFPSICHDLDFLLLCLFRADAGHGVVFKDVQIQKELKQREKRDHELLYMYIIARQARSERGQRSVNPHLPEEEATDLRQVFQDAEFDIDPEELAFNKASINLGNMKLERDPSIRKFLFGFLQFLKEGDFLMAVNVSFDSLGYHLVYARAFKDVVSYRFDPFFHDDDKVLRKEIFHTNYITITAPEDIFSQTRDNINLFDKNTNLPIFMECGPYGDPKKANLLVVGPITDEAKKATVNLTLSRMYSSEFIHPNAWLLTVRPLQIAHKNVTKLFLTYSPPKNTYRSMGQQQQVDNETVQDHGIEGEQQEGIGDDNDERRLLESQPSNNSDHGITIEQSIEIKTLRDELKDLANKGKIKLHSVYDYNLKKMVQGIEVKCGDTDCVFEFDMFRFTGTYPDVPATPSPQPGGEDMPDGGGRMDPAKMGLIVPMSLDDLNSILCDGRGAVILNITKEAVLGDMHRVVQQECDSNRAAQEEPLAVAAGQGGENEEPLSALVAEV